MSVRVFAAREGVSPASLYRWLAEARGEEGRPAFVEVRGARPGAISGLSVELPGGVRVRVAGAEPVAFVAALAAALREEEPE